MKGKSYIPTSLRDLTILMKHPIQKRDKNINLKVFFASFFNPIWRPVSSLQIWKVSLYTWWVLRVLYYFKMTWKSRNGCKMGGAIFSLYILNVTFMKPKWIIYFLDSSAMYYIEDITRWREDMNFMFEWQEQCCSCHENIKFISSS